uniref:Fuzzy planar cell polarity protein n=1 Tax=Spermophilus dauricus TaxID=99837 RepID=A0A8C9P495_SPEDA
MGEGTGGSVHLLCLAASSGVPLFCRSSRGGAPSRQQLPFSVIGSLNGVHMFGQNLEVQLSSARTKDTTVVWKSFHDSITLIVLSSEEGTSELKLERLLQMVFGAMVLFVGLEELTNIRNVERLKKELRASYHLIDSFLGDSELIGDLTQCVDCVIPPEGPLLQEALSGFAEAMGTGFVSLMVSGRVVSATEGWWRLGTPEAVLLPWLVGSLPPQAARDYPVYLPHGSPTVPHRLLTLTLLPGLELCLLCGPRPPLSQLDPQVNQEWLLPSGPRGPQEGPPHHRLFNPSGPSPEQRRRLLRHFYALVTSTHFPPEPLEKVEDDVSRAQLPRACYLVLGPEEPGTGLRLIALQLGLRLLLLLLAPQSPTHGLRSLATHTLHTLSRLLGGEGREGLPLAPPK